MKNRISVIIVFSIIVLLACNALLFSKTLSIQDKIAKLEKDTSDLKVENLDLTARLSQMQSINYITEVADKLKFKKSTKVQYVDDPEYALATGYEKN